MKIYGITNCWKKQVCILVGDILYVHVYLKLYSCFAFYIITFVGVGFS